MIAIYKTLKEKEIDSLEKTGNIFNETEVYPRAKFLRKIMKIPYIYLLVPKIIEKIVKTSYRQSPEGFQIEFVKADRNLCQFNIKQCIYYNYCKKYEVAEFCDIFCSGDDVSGAALKPNIIFERKNTLARGGEYCDFYYRIKK
ncbi:L-2-amino-thiazoline-4-carboxylic acid hydrolase [Anaerococcus sp. AGMB00486]|uniref:L-2-amino-thiazoline-4-carboxylic acid hydrolase n=2 Tax=Anaerococcus TaxID=165779 RepID=A0ABX2N7T9_9FIRM|nr:MULTISPECIES: L-2-amino-thiazoline-4-carboxylic acid hydrolase [Anaerococcus]MSS77117.1 hypothetical protein [Anaerococcus porci]NVF10756.1 L-2-amino-thiazoline-4-carboxylic acid hydrolase [Anaerococcus faecalis]